MSNAHGVKLVGPTSKLQHKVKKHDDTNFDSKIHPFELCDKKTKRTNKHVYNYNQIKDNTEMQNCNEQDKAKCELLRHEENKTKQMETNNKSIKKTNSRLHPPLVLLHRKRKNRKKKSHKTVVLYKNPSRVKISTEKVIINCDSSKQIREINKSNRGDDKLITRINNLVQGNKPNNQSKVKNENNVTLENNCGNNTQNYKDKHKKRDRGLICKNSIARVESKHKKKRPILNQQLLNEIVKVASTVDPKLLPNDILDQMKSQPINHDNKHSALPNPSQMAKILKYLNNPTKYKAAHHDTLVNMFKTKSNFFGDKKNVNNPSTDAESQAILEKHRLSEKLPQSALTQRRDKIKQQNNLPVTENLPHNDYKNNKKREKRKKHHGEVEKRNNDYSVSTSKCVKGLQTIDRDYKSNCIKKDSAGASNLNIDDNSKLEGVKFNTITSQNPKLSIVNKAITVKPNKKDGANIESSKLTASSLVKSYVDQTKLEESFKFKQVRKKYKTLYTNKRQTEPSFSNDNKNISFLKCNENSTLKGTKEFKKQDTIIEIPKLNGKAGGECCDLPPKKDPQKLLYASRESSNNFLSKKKNRLNTISSSQCINKNRFKAVCSIKDLYQNGRNEQNRTDQMNSSNFNNSQEYSKNCIHVETMEDNLKKNRDKFVVVLPMDSNDIVVDKNCIAKDGVFTQNKTVEGNSCKPSFILENKCHVSEIGVQTDSLKDKNVDFSKLLSRENVEATGKEGGIGVLRYSTNINESLFCKSDDDAKNPFRRKSFVHIITDQHEIGENNCCMESNPISSEENNCDLPNNNNTENKTELNPDMLNESNETNNHLIYKINAIYEYLQYFDKLLRNKAFVSCYGSCESMNTIGQFNNILHCLCTNCLEVLNKIGSNPLSERCKKVTNHNKSTDKSVFQSLENIASNTRHKFLNIIENDPLKSETEKQLYPQLSKNMTSRDVFLNKTLFPKTMSKIQIDSKDNIAKLAHYATPYLDLLHGFDIKTEPDLTKRNSATKLYKSKIPIELVQTVPRNDLQSTIISDKKLPFVNKIDMLISEKIQSNLDDIQGKRQLFVNSISECSSTNKTRTNQFPNEKTNRQWLGPVTPPTEKRQLFINIVQEDCSNKIENNQEIQFSTETKDLKLDGFCPIVTKQNTRANYCKVDHKPFVVIVPSNHSNLGDKVEYQSTHKNMNYFNTGSELKIVTSNSHIREDYFDSLLLERKKKNSDAQDIWWKDKYGSRQCNSRKITEGWGESSSCKIMNEPNNKQQSCTDKKYNKYYMSEKNEKHLSDKKFIRSKGHLSLGKKFLKCIHSKSACHLTRVKSTECNISDTERRNEKVVCKSIRFNSSSLTQSTESREVSECCFCYDNEIKSVCGVHKVMCSQKSNMDKYNYEKHSNPKKINHNKNHLVYCDPKKKLEYKIKRPEQISCIDDNKNCNENQMYVPAFMIMKNNARVIDKFLGTQLLDQDTQSSSEFINFPKETIKDIRLSLKKGYPEIDTNSLNDLQNEFLADSNHLYYNKINKFQTSEESNKCENKTTHSPLLSNITGEIKYLDNENKRFLFEESDITNTILHKTENSKFVSESSFGSDFNCEFLKKSLTFTNNKPLLENKAIKEDRKLFNEKKSVSSIYLLDKTALYTNPHKIPSIESSMVYNTESKTKGIKKYKNAINSIPPFNVKEEESKSSLSSFDFQNNKLKIFFNKNISPVEGAQFEGNENTKVKNEVDGTDKWISLNKCDFQNTGSSTTELADTKDKTIGFKMNIKVSDMHIQFSCQSPDLTLENKIIN